MRRVMLVVLLVLAGVSVTSPAAACSILAPGPTEAELVAQADVVFEGTAVARRDPNVGAAIIGSGDPIVWTFAVDRAIKGPGGLQLDVQSARFEASCGITFTIGTRYLVLARNVGGVLTTALGSGTREAPLVVTTTTTSTTTPSVTTTTPVRPASPPRRIALTG